MPTLIRILAKEALAYFAFSYSAAYSTKTLRFLRSAERGNQSNSFLRVGIKPTIRCIYKISKYYVLFL